MKTVKGKKYRVKIDPCGFFKPGDIVVALEDDRVPFCVSEKYYNSEFKCAEPYSKRSPLKAIYLEEV